MFDETEESLTFHHRLELLDTAKDQVEIFKEVKNANFQIEVDTITPVDGETIRFLCSSDKGDKQKSYLFTWRPFVKDEKKVMAKLEMIKAPVTKLYSFDRLLLLTPPKEKTQVFSVFKKGEHATTITLCTHGLTKIDEITVEGRFHDAELSQDGRLYAIREEKVAVLESSIPSNTLKLKASVELQLSRVFLVGKHVLAVNKDGDRVLYDSDFELVMRSPSESSGSVVSIVEVSKEEFLVVTCEVIERWNVKKEEVRTLKVEFEVISACLEGNTVLITQTDRIHKMDLSRI